MFFLPFAYRYVFTLSSYFETRPVVYHNVYHHQLCSRDCDQGLTQGRKMEDGGYFPSSDWRR